MSLFSFLNNNQEEISILLDIGNGSINGAIVSFAKSKLPKILFSAEVPFSVSLQPNSEALSSEMKTLLDQIVVHLIKTGLKQADLSTHSTRIKEVLVTLSSPWFALKAKHVNLTQSNLFVITKDFLEDIIQKEEKLFEEELSVTSSNKSFEIVEKSIVHTKINGYELKSSVGRRTKNFDAYLCLSVVAKETIDIIRGVVLKNSHIPNNRVTVHSFPIASFIVIRDIFSANSDFIIMDITGEVTDLTLVEDNVVIKSISMPSGKNFIIRQITKKLDVSSEIAESHLHLYTEEKLEPNMTSRMQEILLDVEKEWSIYLENAIQELSPNKQPPSTVYLTVDPIVATIYKDFLNLVKTDSTADFRKNINIIHLNEDTMTHFYDKKIGVIVNEFIAIVAIFYNKIFQDK